jgi:hypothetical protein
MPACMGFTWIEGKQKIYGKDYRKEERFAKLFI